MKELLRQTPDMPATVLAERVRWWVEQVVPGQVKRLRPEQRRINPADRLVWEPGDAAQCDLCSKLPVLVITTAHSKFIAGRMIPIRRTKDLPLGTWEMLQQIGTAPPVCLGQGAHRAPQRVVRDIVHARPIVRVPIGFHHPVR